MREIKFRFWIEKAGKMATWKQAKQECDRLSLLSFPGFIPMQFTGLHDRNGNEIWEKDIIDWISDNNKMVVRYDQVDAGFKLTTPSGLGTLGFWPPSDDMEVVGNLYENPNLIND